MTDKVVAMQASDPFALNANFTEQRSNDNDAADFAQVQDENGDTAGGCESAAFNDRNEYTANYGYCGVDIVSDAATHWTTFGEPFGAKLPTEYRISFGVEGQPTVDVTGHQHDSNPHVNAVGGGILADADMSTVIPASTGGIGAPDIWVNSDGDSDPIEVEVTFSLEHVDRNGSDGQHFVGNNKEFVARVTARYTGVPTLNTTGWKVPSQNTGDDNGDFDSFVITAHQFILRN